MKLRLPRIRPRHVATPEELPEEDRRDNKRRREDRWRLRLNRGWMAVITALWLWLALTVKDQIGDLKTEQADRIDATCTINEKKQAKDIRQLGRTYDYLLGLSDKELRAILANPAAVGGIVEAEADADIDDAPGYCDKESVGEPEPDLKVPDRPDDLKVLLPPREEASGK